MVHQGESLALGLKAGDHLARVHAGFDELERDQALDGLRLLGHVHRAHAAFADWFDELEGADDRTKSLRYGFINSAADTRSRLFEKAAGPVLRGQHLFHATAKIGIAGAGPVEVGGALARRA